MGVPADDRRRHLNKVANPLSDTTPYLRTSLLPGLFGAVGRNRSRGQDDLALYESGSVFFAPETPVTAPSPTVTQRPSADELAALDRALGYQPRHLAVVLTGQWQPAGWTGPARSAGWSARAGLRRGRRPGGRPHPRSADGRAGTLASRPVCSVRHGRRIGDRLRRRAASRGLHGLRPARPDVRRRDRPRRVDRRGSLGRGDPAWCRPSRWPRRMWPWWSTRPYRRRPWSWRCGRGPVRCWSRSPCSTSTPAPRSARARSRWRTRCGSARPTAP